MVYNLIVSEHAEELLDNLLRYLLYKLKNEQAALHLMDSIEKIYSRLECDPYQFLECLDQYLKAKKYREAVISGMNYVIIFQIVDNEVHIMGIFHQLENYSSKL